MRENSSRTPIFLPLRPADVDVDALARIISRRVHGTNEKKSLCKIITVTDRAPPPPPTTPSSTDWRGTLRRIVIKGVVLLLVRDSEGGRDRP